MKFTDEELTTILAALRTQRSSLIEDINSNPEVTELGISICQLELENVNVLLTKLSEGGFNTKTHQGGDTWG